MVVLSIDLGGTKLAVALITETGKILSQDNIALGTRKGSEVGQLIQVVIRKMFEISKTFNNNIIAIGISVPGISYRKKGIVWAPNINGWNDYPLLDEVYEIVNNIPVIIESDRACYISGEVWKGNAKGCKDAIFLAVGTGIGAGILINGEILRGSQDIAGSVGWMALNRSFIDSYTKYGCFEYHASGEGISRIAKSYLRQHKNYCGELSNKKIDKITSYDVFVAFNNDDFLAKKVIAECIEYWGVAVANLVSIFNPEKIIFGGGIFGPAIPLLPAIKKESEKWAQPRSIKQVVFDISGLGGDAGIYGAGYLALKSHHNTKNR